MVPLRVATLTSARNKPNFSALIFSDGKAPTGNSVDYKQRLRTSAEWVS